MSVLIFILFAYLPYTITDPPPHFTTPFFLFLALPPSSEKSHPFLHLHPPPSPVSPLPQKHSQINFNTICSLKARACLCHFISSSPLKGHTQTLRSTLILRSLLQISCFLSQKPATPQARIGLDLLVLFSSVILHTWTCSVFLREGV